MGCRWMAVFWLVAAVLTAAPGRADEPSDATARAREMFNRGADLVRAAQWGEALAAFEQSSRLHPHATTTFNMGACERAMGRYTRARLTFSKALDEARANPAQLPEELATETRGYLEQIDGLLVRVSITLVPANAEVSVDGRPLQARTEFGPGTTMVAGLLPPGRPAPVPAGSFEVVLSRRGYSDALVNRTFAAGARTQLRLELALLPATLHIDSVPPGAVVVLDGREVGPAPVDVVRHAGSYYVTVHARGYETYEAQVRVSAGEASNLRATLARERVSIARKWWFWTGAAAVVAGGVALTYALTRPEPQPPAYSGGSTGWVVRPSALSLPW
jgi:tetratricopeptide (TPR) repeat protein